MSARGKVYAFDILATDFNDSAHFGEKSFDGRCMTNYFRNSFVSPLDISLGYARCDQRPPFSASLTQGSQGLFQARGHSATYIRSNTSDVAG